MPFLTYINPYKNLQKLCYIVFWVFAVSKNTAQSAGPRKTYSATFGSAPKHRDDRSESPGPGAYQQNFSVRSPVVVGGLVGSQVGTNDGLGGSQ